MSGVLDMILLILFVACLIDAYGLPEFNLVATCVGWGYCLPSSWLLDLAGTN
jgi:hypothetical protein